MIGRGLFLANGRAANYQRVCTNRAMDTLLEYTHLGISPAFPRVGGKPDHVSSQGKEAIFVTHDICQDQDDGTTRVIAYASRNLSKSEKRYHSSKLEFLALKWSVCERFHKYLYGGKFQVYTDNNPLTYILTTTKLDTTGQWWVASLANYDFTIHRRAGSKSKVMMRILVQ